MNVSSGGINLSKNDREKTSSYHQQTKNKRVLFVSLIIIVASLAFFFNYMLPLNNHKQNINGIVQYPGFTMAEVGEPAEIYTLPTGTDDAGKIIIRSTRTAGQSLAIPTGANTDGTADVNGGYHLATTPVTYELWYEVFQWAEANGFFFANRGMEGSITGGGSRPNYYNIGNPPTTAKNEPVTMVSWYDCIVWLNALSEKLGFEPAYRSTSGSVIRDARDSNILDLEIVVQADTNGFRLPTNMEWEMAARWRNDTSSTDGSIEKGGRQWTPGNHASGATADYENIEATEEVLWWRQNSDTGQGPKTQPVGQKKANDLGLYDMSGNVWEWCYDSTDSNRIVRGGCWLNRRYHLMQLSYEFSYEPTFAFYTIGFRFARTP